MYWLIERKDNVLNYIAKWCINHCYLYCDTIYALLMKLRINDIEYRYAALIDEMSSFISEKVFEKAISSCNTVNEFKNLLICEKSNYATIIKNKFDTYENLY